MTTMPLEKIAKLNTIAKSFGFEWFSISEESITGRFPIGQLPDKFTTFEEIQNFLDLANVDRHFIALELMSLNEITNDTQKKQAKKILKRYRKGLESLKKAGL